MTGASQSFAEEPSRPSLFSWGMLADLRSSVPP
jgi:hypothetical protein